MGLLTLQQLETHLWGAADILRGAVDSGDYKNYILGLLFYKRVCDVWEEESEERLQHSHDQTQAANPDQHRFHIPKGSFLGDLCRQTTHIGRHLNNAFHQIETSNPQLRGIWSNVDFAHRERFSDALLERLLRHFETFRLRKADCAADMLGNAYEYLIAQFADDAGKKGGEFYTPQMVVRTIVACLQPREGMSIYDPTCGSGGMLLECVHYLARTGQNPKTLKIYGQERNIHTWAISAMNLFLHDVDDAAIARGDTLQDPKHLCPDDPTKLLTFDRVLANPPFSLRGWGYEVWKNGDRFGRDHYGCPPKSYGDLAFVQHMLASLKVGGLLGVIVPHGILFREGMEGKIRAGLLQDDYIEAVIGLAPNLFYGTGIPASILIINKQKPENKRGKVLFIQGAAERVSGKKQNRLTDANVARLSQAFHNYRDEDDFARLVGMDEIASNRYNLNISKYIHVGDIEERMDVAVEIAKLVELQHQREAAEAKMMAYLQELGYGN